MTSVSQDVATNHPDKFEFMAPTLRQKNSRNMIVCKNEFTIRFSDGMSEVDQSKFFERYDLAKVGLWKESIDRTAKLKITKENPFSLKRLFDTIESIYQNEVVDNKTVKWVEPNLYFQIQR